MKTQKPRPQVDPQQHLPSVEAIRQELGKVQSMDDFFGKDGVFARLFAETLEQMLDAELTAQLGYEPYEAKGRNSGNSRNGHYRKRVRTSSGETEVTVPRDRNSEFEPHILQKYQTNTNELEDKIIAMYARGMTQRDIEDQLAELYGIEVSAQTISTITDKVLPLVEPSAGGGVSHRLPGCHPLQAAQRPPDRKSGHLHRAGGGSGRLQGCAGPLGQ
jgi:hypothetical protein